MATVGDGEGRRRALVVATGTYADATLAGLRAPGRDAAELAAILQDAAVGGFDVETVLDVPADGLRRRVARFCAQGGPGDLALVYISCHGVLDDRGRLYYATTDTDHELLAATAIPAAWLNEQLDDCRCRRQIVILDCCHSGAFAKGAKGEGALALRERFEGRGRVVLTASRATEYSFEGDRVLGDGVSSVFTDVLVQGLRSGDADRDGDGVVTVTELYEYAYEAVRSRDARQTPMLWTYGAEGGLLVAHSVRGAMIEPVPLSDDLVALLESARPRVRESAVAELAELLTGPDPGRALTAREHLERVAAEDIPRVAALARAALEGEEVAPSPDAALPAAPPPAVPPGAKPEALAASSSPPRRRPSRRMLIAAGALIAAVVAVGLVVLPSDNPGTGSEPLSVPRSGPISMKGSPRGIAAGGKQMWIALHDDGTVNRIDANSSLNVVDVDDYPETIVADDEGTAWVTTGGETALTRIDADNGPAAPIRDVITQQAGCVCPSADMAIAFGALWVAKPRDNAIVNRDLVSGKLLGTWHLPDGFEGRFAVGDPEESVLWAVGTTDDRHGPAWLERVNARVPGEVKRDNLDDIVHPGGVAYSNDAVWITDDRNDTLVRFDPAKRKPPVTIRIEDGVTSDDIVAVKDALLLWNPNSGRLTRVDPKTGQEVGRPIPVPGFEPGDQRDATDKQRNLLSSEIAVVDGIAWVTDPVSDRVFRVEY